MSDRTQAALWLYTRHYTFSGLASRRHGFVGNGAKLTLLTADGRAVFGWLMCKPGLRRDGQAGTCCTIFRNEGPALSSDLIAEADRLAWTIWPGERHFTYVNAAKVASANPGYCFKRAGWRHCGYSKAGLHLLERLP